MLILLIVLTSYNGSNSPSICSPCSLIPYIKTSTKFLIQIQNYFYQINTVLYFLVILFTFFFCSHTLNGHFSTLIFISLIYNTFQKIVPSIIFNFIFCFRVKLFFSTCLSIPPSIIEPIADNCLLFIITSGYLQVIIQ